jgi:hypothetical protein
MLDMERKRPQSKRARSGLREKFDRARARMCLSNVVDYVDDATYSRCYELSQWCTVVFVVLSDVAACLSRPRIRRWPSNCSKLFRCIDNMANVSRKCTPHRHYKQYHRQNFSSLFDARQTYLADLGMRNVHIHI